MSEQVTTTPLAPAGARADPALKSSVCAASKTARSSTKRRNQPRLASSRLRGTRTGSKTRSDARKRLLHLHLPKPKSPKSWLSFSTEEPWSLLQTGSIASRRMPTARCEHEERLETTGDTCPVEASWPKQALRSVCFICKECPARPTMSVATLNCAKHSLKDSIHTPCARLVPKLSATNDDAAQA